MRVQHLLVVILIVALASSEARIERLQGKKKAKHHHKVKSSTSTSTSTSTTTSTTEEPPTTSPSPTEADDAEKVLYLDNMDIIKIHLPMPVQHHYLYNCSTTAAPSASPETAPANPVPSSLPTAPPRRDEHTEFTVAPDQHGSPTTNQEGPVDAGTTEVTEQPRATEEPRMTEEPMVTAETAITEEPSSTRNTKEDWTTPAGDAAVDDGDSDADEVTIPDVATFDAVFSNRSRLSDDIRVFTFGGIYEIIVNRTRNSVDVVMVRHHTSQLNETVPLTEVTVKPDAAAHNGLQMLVRGPSFTGLERQDDQQPNAHNRDESNKSDRTDRKMNDKTEDEQNKAHHDNRHSKDQAADDFDAVFINGSALNGIGIGVYSFNTSGTFQMNVSVAEDFMTVIISQVSQQIAKDGNAPLAMLPFVWPNSPQVPTDAEEPADSQAPPKAHMLRSSVPDDYEAEDSDSAVWPVLMLVGSVGAVGTLLGAVVLWRVRSGARAAGFARRGDQEFYGSVEPGVDPATAPFYARSQYEPLQ